ncbi:dehydrodolichyl diphosphate synthase [Chrysochromulina tobinii]|uniref:Alkyl transferase n=1 Tax=Chrysochromulina tobinii TaxID=1460289 RepID=A0A0M0JDC1_9EUKA|nr:dehydrodolichyl diphosphate synthase [Chrysochromulina tobinii]|eukprot:KOO24571.1 dehydrodolichyl diphosphate synthase [Chrysochromulina sp. CCMP291]
MEVARGHKMGYDKLEQVLRWCCELGVHGVTVYAFSIENFKRSQSEVDALMALAEEGLREMSDETHLVQRRGVRVRVVGDLSRVSASLYGEMQRVMRMTQGNTRHTLTVCFSYTSRNEIAASIRRLGKACADGRLLPSDINAALLERCLLTTAPGLPPVDLIGGDAGGSRATTALSKPLAVCEGKLATANVKTVDMTEDMEKVAIELASFAMNEFTKEVEMAAHIKKEFDKMYSPTWHVVVGTNFGSHVVHQTKNFVYFNIGAINFLVYKSG